MESYFNNLSEPIKKYFNILSEEIPDFLYEYVNTPEMQQQGGISKSCGICYSKLSNVQLRYSNLDHSVGVALIVWHFTKDKKQTLSGLFHDISTSVFKHSLDFMNKDYEKQEKSEELTTKIISESNEIMSLLNRDGIKIEEVSDYHIYPIADNETPKLSADRLEYTFSDGLGVMGEKLWNLDEVREIYQNIQVQKNEEQIEEIGFKNKEIAEKFVENMSKLSIFYRENRFKFTMQFLADIIKKSLEKNILDEKDLYHLSEKEIIQKIENCGEEDITKCFKIWKEATKINESDVLVQDKYCVSIEKIKIRYINPLVKRGNTSRRISDISMKAKQDIEKALNFKTKKYAYLDFNF